MSLWSDRSFLRDVQYRTDANLAARKVPTRRSARLAR